MCFGYIWTGFLGDPGTNLPGCTGIDVHYLRLLPRPLHGHVMGFGGLTESPITGFPHCHEPPSRLVLGEADSMAVEHPNTLCPCQHIKELAASAILHAAFTPSAFCPLQDPREVSHSECRDLGLSLGGLPIWTLHLSSLWSLLTEGSPTIVQGALWVGRGYAQIFRTLIFKYIKASCRHTFLVPLLKPERRFHCFTFLLKQITA